MPYTVRNTFIDDVAPGPSSQAPDLFGTWPLARVSALEAPGEELEEGELSDQASEGVEPSGLEKENVVSPSSVGTAGDAPLASARSHAVPPTVSYAVRNTFIDVSGGPVQSSTEAADGVFCTWPLSRDACADAGGQELEDGELPQSAAGSEDGRSTPAGAEVAFDTLVDFESADAPPGLPDVVTSARLDANCSSVTSASPASGDSPLKVPSVGYTVRNTFIDDVDKTPTMKNADAGETMFCTWPLASAPWPENGTRTGMLAADEIAEGVPPLEADLEEGELAEESEDGAVVDEGEDAGPVPPASQRPAQSSMGSALHDTGGCKPCAWMYKDPDTGCRNGDRCQYCHLCPPGEVKRRKRDKLLQRLARSSPKKPAGQDSPQRPVCRNAGDAALEMEPCYIEVPGLTENQPRNLPLASAGSAGHGSGSCRPCAWLHKAPAGAGCKNGQSCQYCHICAPGELKRRKREKFKAQNAALMEKFMLQAA